MKMTPLGNTLGAQVDNIDLSQLSDTEFAALYQARQSKYHVRFRWQKHSVAIWDNRATQHYAVTDYGDAPRRLHRVTVQGDSAQ